MAETQERQHDQTQENASEHPEETPEPQKEEVTRPRAKEEAEGMVQRGRERIQQRSLREVLETRGIDASTRPRRSESHSRQQLEKLPVETRRGAVKEDDVQPVGVIEDRETVKWSAYGALLASLVAIILLALYSQRDFSPTFEYHDLKIVQDQLDKRVNDLEYSSQLGKVRNAVLTAQLQIFVQEDPETAERFLVQAKEELNTFIAALPIEQTTKPKELLGNIDRVLREIRRPPSPLQEQFKTLLTGLENL